MTAPIDPRALDAAVKQAVLDWSAAPTVEQGAKVLAKRCAELAPHLRESLFSEVAEVTSETLVEFLSNPEGRSADEPTITHEGVTLAQTQLFRLSVWAHDQAAIAQALGMTLAEWEVHLDAGFERTMVRIKAQIEAQGQSLPEGIQNAAALLQTERFLGGAQKRFENRPAPGTSAQAGIAGLIALRNFDKK
jgi:hypothetical protein